MEQTWLPQSLVPNAERLSEAGLLLQLGRLRRKQVKRLRRGEGPLAAQVRALVDQQRHDLGLDDDAEIVPVVLLYRESKPDYVVLTPVRRTEDR
jgi:hypothetical protein